MAAISWKTGISGNWSQASNWSPQTVPSSSDDVTISASGSYTINLDTAFDVSSLIFDAPGATINIPATSFLATFHGATITGGTIDGPGMFELLGVSSITPGPPLTLGGGDSSGRPTFRIDGSSSLSLSAAIDVGDAAGPNAIIQNFGTFNLISDAAGIGVNPSGNGNFQNNAVLEKTGGSGTSQLFASVTNTGTVSITTGTLEFDGPSNTLSGTISGVGTIAFGAGSTQLEVTPTVSNFLIDGGNVTLAGNTSTLTGSFTLLGGALNFGAAVTLTLPAAVNFGGGSVTGGTLMLNGNTAVTGGTTAIHPAVVNNGTIAASAGLLDLAGAVSGNGHITIGTGAVVDLGQTSAATQRVNFVDATGTLKIDQPGLFKSPISGFQAGDTIDLAGISATSALYLNGGLRLFSGGTPLPQLTLSTPYAHNAFGIAPDGAGGTLVTVAPLTVLAKSDFDDDGNSDILFQNTNGAVDIWTINGTVPTAEKFVQALDPSWHVIGTGDFDGDGKADILFQNTNGAIDIWGMNGTAPTSETFVHAVDPSWHAIATGDFDGNGKADILFQNTNGAIDIWGMSGATPTSQTFVQALDPSWHAIATGDFNGDGKADILFQNTNGAIDIWGMSGATPTSETFVQALDPSWHAIATGDFNGDGKADIVFQNTSGAIDIWGMSGATPTSETFVQALDSSWHVKGTGDYNGDGKADILFQNNNGAVAVWFMSGATPLAETLIQNVDPSWHIQAG